MDFNGNIPCSRNTAANGYIINQRFHNFTGQMFQVGVFLNQFAAVVACRIAENDEGGWSIFLGEKRNIKIGNYASYERARHVAEDLNFFLVEDAK